MSDAVFRDRGQAGERLAAALTSYADRDDVIVLGLPRGGVPVAYEVARALHAPLDVIIVRKLGVPGCEELAMGAIASGGVQVLHDAVLSALSVSHLAVRSATAAALKEIERRELAYRGRHGLPDVRGMTAILVDDGIATGSTIRAALLALRRCRPKAIVIAVPVTSADSREMLKPFVDEFIALMVPSDFRAVGQWYADFSQVTDAEVAQFLARASAAQPRDETIPKVMSPSL